ncbi:Uncharacterized protein OBRU01_05233 [Operophtera brumata]|uniref:Oleoyl-[acyl-carrier-protein] hydrolase n=1 Tax=Operophtera brumata TaxID=104452 RepID=A0A0L7LMK6_OPEBR|nr:Uncharacterized protein OBRU01_05233 [Operophtera brumata]
MYEIIKEACQINYPVDKTMASHKISDIMSSHETTKANDGLGAFFTYIDKDELLAAEPMVAMATTFSNIKDEEELDQKATYLMLVPGFEGHHEVLSKTCERLKVQAMTFQYGPELINADIPEMAASMLKFMKNRVELKSKFYILGYSFGHIGVVYCLDSSPEALRAQLDAYLGHLTDAQLQNELVEHMYRLMNGQDSNELIQQLGKTDSWEEKIELCVNKLRGKVNYSHQYKSCIIQGAYRRIMLAREYEPDFKLESEIVLMRGVPHPKMKKQADDYGLSKYSMKPVHVFEIEADHRLAPHDSRVSNIVNRFLEPKLLEAYKKQNLCFSYLDDTSKALSR